MIQWSLSISWRKKRIMKEPTENDTQSDQSSSDSEKNSGRSKSKQKLFFIIGKDSQTQQISVWAVIPTTDRRTIKTRLSEIVEEAEKSNPDVLFSIAQSVDSIWYNSKNVHSLKRKDIRKDK